MNNLQLLGNLTKDNELRMTQSGIAVVSNTLAIRKDKDTTNFIPFTAFGKTAELLKNYTAKGSKIALEGMIQDGTYEKEGKKIYKLDVIANKIHLLDSKTKETTTPYDFKEEKHDDYADFGNNLDIQPDDLPF